MITSTQYEIQSGKITGTFTATSTEYILANQKDGYAFIDGDFPSDEYYVINQNIQPRPDFDLILSKQIIVADGQDSIQVTGLPTGSSNIRVIGPVPSTWDEDDEGFALSANMVGMYSIEVDHWPYKTAQALFHAT